VNAITNTTDPAKMSQVSFLNLYVHTGVNLNCRIAGSLILLQ
jgi:hypothetical protein